MPFKLGSTTVNSFRLGSTAVSKVYAGSSTVWTSATLLLHFDGSNGSTTFTDSSAAAHSVAASGGATLTTADQKFGSASMTGGYAYIASASDLVFDTSDFTIECWFKLNSHKDANGLFGMRAGGGSSGILCYVSDAGYAGAFVSNNNSGWQATAFGTGLSVSLNAWHHLACVLDGGVLRFFLDGVQGNTLTLSAAPGGDGTFTVGARGGDGESTIDGYIDEFRVVKGTAIYTANFTPPTAPF